MTAAPRINWRGSPSRYPRTTSKRRSTTAKETNTVCQRVDPAAGVCISGSRNGPLPQSVVAKDERGHRFHDWDRARKDTRVMAAAGRERRSFAGCGHRLLLTRNRRRGLERHPKENVFAV